MSSRMWAVLREVGTPVVSQPGFRTGSAQDQRACDGPEVEVSRRPRPHGSESRTEEMKLSRATRKPSECEWSRVFSSNGIWSKVHVSVFNDMLPHY